MIDFVMFDCDGTLVDSERANLGMIIAALNKLGANGLNIEDMLEVFRGRSFPEILAIINRDLKIKVSAADLSLAIKNEDEDAGNNVAAIKNSYQTLESIKCAKAVVSNGNRDTVLRYLKFTNLIKFFGEDNIYSFQQVARPKPEPDIIFHALNQHGKLAENSLLIEDSETGILAGKAAGVRVLGFIGSSENPEEHRKLLLRAGADEIISDLSSILNELD
jgi:HAD superfamily hydrolase (TIGR01509 family)